MDEVHTMGSSKFQGYGKKIIREAHGPHNPQIPPPLLTTNCWPFLGSFGSV